MTVLSACQSAAKLLKPAQTVPPAIFGSTEPFAVELGALVNESAQAIFKAHDWRKLITLHTQAGDGAATAFDLPSDYDRMPVKAGIFLASNALLMTPVQDLDIWLDHRLRGFSALCGEWIILGGQLHIDPAIASGDSAKFYYITNKIALDDASAAKATFTADTDRFRLPERLLMLDLVWRWRHRKGLDYADDMQNFEIAKSEEIKADKGSRMLKIGRSRFPAGVTPAYPWAIDA